MPKTRLISPGSIPNHKLLKNLQLQNHYISNDGDNEGISIDNDGLVTIGTNAATKIDRNTSGDATENALALQIDFDRTVATSGTAVHNDRGIDLDVTSASLGTSFATGMDIDVVGATSGTQTIAGIDIDTSGATKNFGLKIKNEDNGSSDGTEADFINYSSADTNDYFYMNTEASGETTLGTIDGGGTGGHIRLAPNGKLQVHSGSGNNPYAYFHKVVDVDRLRIFGFGVTDDYFNIDVDVNAATTISTFDDAGADAHLTFAVDGHIDMGKATGFTQVEETFSDDTLLTTGGTHDTQIDFRIGNKIYLQLTASMDQINLIFPAVSGNFLLLARSDGDWSIGDWKVWESDLTAANTNDVAWPGGTQPDHTDTGRDIYSFYWDADNQTCYGVASLAFATPS